MDRLREGHRKIRQISDAFDVVIADGRPADPRELAQLRWSLIKEILQHMALEQQVALGPLSQDSRPEAAEVAQRFRDELAELNQLFNAHVARWNGHIDEREWPEYRNAVRRILNTIRSRLLREEVELLPLLPAQTEAEPARASQRDWLDQGPQFRAMLAGDSGIRSAAPETLWRPREWVRTVQ